MLKLMFDIINYGCAILSKSNVNCWKQQRKVLILTSQRYWNSRIPNKGHPGHFKNNLQILDNQLWCPKCRLQNQCISNLRRVTTSLQLSSGLMQSFVQWSLQIMDTFRTPLLRGCPLSEVKRKSPFGTLNLVLYSEVISIVSFIGVSFI